MVVKRMSEFKCPSCGAELTATAKPKPTSEPAQKIATVEQARALFPKDLEDLLMFDQLTDHIRISPRQYLGSDNFSKIVKIVKANGGDYVSAGKESHFRI